MLHLLERVTKSTKLIPQLKGGNYTNAKTPGRDICTMP